MLYAPALSRDQSFDRFVKNVFAAPASYRAVNVTQDEKSWTITLDLPGVPREHLDVDIEGAVVAISTKEEAKRKFKAAYELPEEIDAEATEARLQDGVLTLVLGKKKPVSNARKIEVK